MFLTDNTWRLYFYKQISFCFLRPFLITIFQRSFIFRRSNSAISYFWPIKDFFVLELVLELRGFDIDKMNEEGNKIYNSYSSGNVLLVICGSHLWSFGLHHKLKLTKILSMKEKYFLVRAGIYRQTFVHLYARSSPSTFAYFSLSVVRIGPWGGWSVGFIRTPGFVPLRPSGGHFGSSVVRIRPLVRDGLIAYKL